VLVKVGPAQTKYTVQKAFLSHYSEYFRNALNGSWKEAEEGTIVLNEVETGVFNLFVDWIYTQKLLEYPTDWLVAADCSCEPEKVVMHTNLLKIKLYVFADRFLAPCLRKLLNRAIVSNVRDGSCSPSIWTIIYAFENLQATDPVLNYLVDARCTSDGTLYDSTEEKEMYGELPHEFLVRYMERSTEMRVRGIKLKDLHICDYHGHESGEK
ncbi:hypothetical protein BU26DRAFT_412709, partial [Trematosphaeria pertusa]